MQIIHYAAIPKEMLANYPKTMHILSTYQTPPCLNYCLFPNNHVAQKVYSQSFRQDISSIFNGKADPRSA